MRWTFGEWQAFPDGKRRTVALEVNGRQYEKRMFVAKGAVVTEPRVYERVTLKMCREAMTDALYEQHPELFQRAA